MAIELISVNVGKPAIQKFEGLEVLTGIDKTPVRGPLYLSRINLDGDEQADLINHGGTDKAICVYCAEHYSHCEQVLGVKLAMGAFGENFTIRGLTEQEVCIGDVFQIGEAVVQVTQPRGPCYKLGRKHRFLELPIMLEQRGYTGYYFRVLLEGTVAPGLAVVPVERHPLGVTVAEANRLMYRDKHEEAGLRRILSVAELSESWRGKFASRLAEVGP
ncbi:MAG: sulfurase [Paenibacillaceae bacterium]|nr:sulfurase [Paenibacillaceae bacterium]